MLDLHRLHLLAEFAARGSIAATAAALGYSPSAVSQQLATLEREAGTPLLDRTPRRAELTRAGRVLAERAAHILAAVESAESDLAAAAGQPTGRVVVAGFPTVVVALAPGVTRRLQRHRDVMLLMRQATPEESLRQVRSGEVDLALVDDWTRRLPRDPERLLTYQRLLDDPLVLAVPRRHPLADPSRAYRLADLLGERWIAASRDEPSRRAIDALLETVGEAPPVPWELEGLGAILALVGRGLGITVVPALALRSGPAGVATRQLPVPTRTRHIYLVARSSRLAHPAVAVTSRAFVEAAAEVAGSLPT